LPRRSGNGANEAAQRANPGTFFIVATNIARVEAMRRCGGTHSPFALANFAERAWRRPLKPEELKGLRAFYRASRSDNGLDTKKPCAIALRAC